MGKAFIQESTLTDIADAIRSKNGSNDTYLPSEMADAISDIPIAIEEKDVNFYDWEGTLLYSYTKAEFNELTELPPAPDRTSQNLVFEEWNFDINTLKSLAAKGYNDWVGCGAIYHTLDNKTHLTIKPTDVCPKIYLYIAASIANDTTIDWGDGNSIILSDTNATQLEHTYTSFDERDITIYSESGTHSFPAYLCGSQDNNMSSKIVCFKAANTFRVTAFQDNLKGRFSRLDSIVNVSLSKYNISGTNGRLFSYSSIRHLNTPSTGGVGDFGLYACYSLSVATGVGGGYNLAAYCYSLKKITCYSFNDDNMVNSCYNLEHICIYGNTTTKTSATFNNCNKLKIIIITDNITILNGSTVANCYSLQKLYVMPTTPPTAQSSVFTSLPIFTRIYVPVGTLSTYQSATNWSNFASQMVEYDYTTNPDNV